jgi:2-(1,2-epoxy-1,2-dihydrophenyl)acetyl-CoA isomerase
MTPQTEGTRGSPAEDTVRYEVSDGVAVITLDRPSSLNALTDAMMDELLPAACRRADADPSVRVVVLTGAGENFCSGGDVEQRVAAVQRRLRDTLEDRQRDLGEFVLPLLSIEKPTIAAIDGVAAGGGLALALACDLRTAAESARFSAPFLLRGLVPDGGATVSLVGAVGYATAMDMALTGRPVTADEALRIGLVQRVWGRAQWWSRSLELAREMAALPHQAALLTKRALSGDREAVLRRALVTESWFQSICMRDPDFAEGIAAFLQKRPPRFRQ